MIKISLIGKTALVTGGSSGIGESCVRLLRESGADVYFTYNKNRENAARIAAETSARAIKCNVAEESQCKAAVERAADVSGRIDILVNNAGIYQNAAAGSKEFIGAWRNVMCVNLDSYAYFIHFAVPFMRKAGGKIVNISSIHAVDGTANAAAYHSSKSGVDGLTRALAVELAPLDIQVNSIGPGPIMTPMWGGPGNKDVTEIAKLIPARRFGQPEEIAYAVVFLSSSMADYITGQTLFIDGGMLVNSFKQ